MKMIENGIVTVRSKSELKEFIDLPFRLYGENRFPCWVPPLKLEMRERLDRRKNPFFEYSEGEYFLFRRNGRTLGRITAGVNRRYIEKFQTPTGFFGFFDCEDDLEAASALFGAAEEWLRERGMKEILGPFNFSTNEEGGVLLKGFDRTPMVMMPYNPEYVPPLLEGCGLAKKKELWAWYVQKDTVLLSDRLKSFVERVEGRGDITIRSIAMGRRFKDDLDKIRVVYNEAWKDNWGFVPFTDREIDALGKSLKPVLDPDLFYIAEERGEPVAFIAGVRDVNKVFYKIKGRLFPFGLFRLLFGISRVKEMRVAVMGVRPAYRRRGLDAVLYYKVISSAISKGIVASEMSWILDDNHGMNNILHNLRASRYKVYGLFGKSLIPEEETLETPSP